MSETVEVFYRVPVCVTVDLAAVEVTRVRVWDEAPEQWANFAGSPGERDAMTRAYDVAEDADWPAWEVG